MEIYKEGGFELYLTNSLKECHVWWLAETKYLNLAETKFESETEWSITTVFQNHMYNKKRTYTQLLEVSIRTDSAEPIPLSLLRTSNIAF